MCTSGSRIPCLYPHLFDCSEYSVGESPSLLWMEAGSTPHTPFRQEPCVDIHCHSVGERRVRNALHASATITNCHMINAGLVGLVNRA
jgi:hypothetical protein